MARKGTKWTDRFGNEREIVDIKELKERPGEKVITVKVTETSYEVHDNFTRPLPER